MEEQGKHISCFSWAPLWSPSIFMLGSFLVKCNFCLLSNHQWISLPQACLVSHWTVLCMGTHKCIYIYIHTHIHTHTKVQIHMYINKLLHFINYWKQLPAARTAYIHIVGRSTSFSFFFNFFFLSNSIILMPNSSVLEVYWNIPFSYCLWFFIPLIPPFRYPFTTLKGS